MELWLVDRHTDDLKVALRVQRTLFRRQSAYQLVEVVETAGFGRALLLDGVLQITEAEEFCYHEMLVHVPLGFHPRPERVLIVGGGDAGALREVLKHEEVREVDLVEIDQVVIEATRECFPRLAAAFDHPKVRLHVADGAQFIRERRDAYDVILVDSTDPGGPSLPLFTEEFYGRCREALRPEGVLSAQSDSPLFTAEVVRQTYRRLRAVGFPIVEVYVSDAPFYALGPWAFVIGSLRHDPRRVLPERVAGLRTRYYNPEVHRACFALPNFVRDLLSG